ncbi:MAG: glycosyltransferase family 1 protein [Lachnospiraceae bacterium]|jgi:Glycosyltransferase|nr:glycosyltransferase family 1 protein [Lachnospiraceae bacterium]
MKNEKIRVLQVNASNFGKGGISTTIFRLMQEINDNNIVFSFLTDKEVPEEYLREIKEKRGTIEKIPDMSLKKNKNWLKYKYLRDVLKKNKYDIVHINGDNALALSPYIFAAKLMKDCKIVVHAHTTGFGEGNAFARRIKENVNNLFRGWILSGIDLKIACCHEAANFMFPRQEIKNVHIMKNGLIPQKYEFVQEKRDALRDEMGVNDKIVVGHIGRFSYAKNHKFLIELFHYMKNENKDVELWLIGDGEDEDSIRNQVHEKGLEKNIRFLGVINNVQDYLCGMDIMVFPSRYEGLPLVLVEAQTNDLPIVCSDVISKDTFFNDKVVSCSLYEPYSKWIKVINKSLGKKRRKMTDETKRAGFDMNDIANKVKELYYSVLN